jgi:hypothetical protein
MSASYVAPRTVAAAGLALTIIITPAAVVAVGGPPASQVPRSVADPPGCTIAWSTASASLNCPPNIRAYPNGAPSEMGLTQSNPGLLAPSRAFH